MAAQQAGQRRRDQPPRNAAGRIDAEPPRHLALAGVEQLVDVFHFRQQGPHALQQLFAVGRQAHLPGRAMQQAHAQLGLQLLDGCRHRGARHLQRVGRLDEAAHVGDQGEHAVLVESVHASGVPCRPRADRPVDNGR
ncbi:hypothetical protein G6F35_016605 [Rhizopus arrhizus]|nr:hypothetical protein G6F35_016605 [Rhizopus arrhizus]